MKKTYDIKDKSLAPKGKQRIEWAGAQMKVLERLKKRFKKEQPLKGYTLAACLHVTAETANLAIALKEGGAKVYLCASNPLSTQDDVAASLSIDYDIPTFAIKGEDKKTYYEHLNAVLDVRPQITMDDGADLATLLHTERTDQLDEIIGSSEETTTGVVRLEAMLREGMLKIPVMAVNESQTKHMFDNRYGTGQSTVDGVVRATNVLLAGKNFVVAGYGWCGRGLASRARGLGAQVIVTEVDHIKALEALMDGYQVMPMSKAIKIADIVITATGNKNVVTVDHIKDAKDGVILGNTGHFNVEFDYDGMKKLAKKTKYVREYVEELSYANEKKVYVLGEGRLINLVSAEGHPPDVMDMSFANQALAAEFFVKNKGNLDVAVYTIPDDMDYEIAKIKLETVGTSIDKLSAEQKKYLSSWHEGT